MIGFKIWDLQNGQTSEISRLKNWNLQMAKLRKYYINGVGGWACVGWRRRALAWREREVEKLIVSCVKVMSQYERASLLGPDPF